MKYDATGRPVLATDWSAISNIPPDVNFWASFPPPTADALLYYDFGLSQIVWVPPEASIIEYDNAVSGLTATNVQDAIDELAQNPKILSSIAGYMLADGTLSYSSAAVTTVKTGTGKYTITHGLNTPNYIFNGQTIVPTNESRQVHAESWNDNAIAINTRLSDATLIDTPIFFLITYW